MLQGRSGFEPVVRLDLQVEEAGRLGDYVTIDAAELLGVPVEVGLVQ